MRTRVYYGVCLSVFAVLSIIVATIYIHTSNFDRYTDAIVGFEGDAGVFDLAKDHATLSDNGKILIEDLDAKTRVYLFRKSIGKGLNFSGVLVVSGPIDHLIHNDHYGAPSMTMSILEPTTSVPALVRLEVNIWATSNPLVFKIGYNLC